MMLNLLAFKPDGGEERYARVRRGYGAPSRAGGRPPPLTPTARRRPSSVTTTGTLVALVEYPTRGAFLEMIGSEEYQAITHMRTESLRRRRARPDGPGRGRAGDGVSATHPS